MAKLVLTSLKIVPLPEAVRDPQGSRIHAHRPSSSTLGERLLRWQAGGVEASLDGPFRAGR